MSKLSRESRFKLKLLFKAINALKLKKLTEVKLTLDNFDFNFYFRAGSRGDIGVIKQIFFNQDYKIINWVHGQALKNYYEKNCSNKTAVVIDAGANIGASCLYFKSIFPLAKLVAIEPAPSNLPILEKNLASIDAKIIKGALSLKAEMFLHDPGSSDWGYQLKENGTIKVDCFSPRQILDGLSGSDYPLIFKIDIEGSEEEIFQENTEWVSSIPLLIVEIHDWMIPGLASSHPFFKAILKHDFDILIRGENVFCFNNMLLKEFYKPKTQRS